MKEMILECKKGFHIKSLMFLSLLLVQHTHVMNAQLNNIIWFWYTYTKANSTKGYCPHSITVP